MNASEGFIGGRREMNRRKRIGGTAVEDAVEAVRLCKIGTSLCFGLSSSALTQLPRLMTRSRLFFLVVPGGQRLTISRAWKD